MIASLRLRAARALIRAARLLYDGDYPETLTVTRGDRTLTVSVSSDVYAHGIITTSGLNWRLDGHRLVGEWEPDHGEISFCWSDELTPADVP